MTPNKKSKKSGPKFSPTTKGAGKPLPSKKTDQKKSGRRTSPLLPGSWQMNIGFFFLFLLATVLLYSGDLHLGFFRIDDQQYVVKNPWIQGATGEHINYILTHPYFVNYSPVHLFSYMFDYAIAGLNPYAFHLSSNIWAGIVAGFVYLVALAFTQNRIIAISSAILFVVHPVHVEAVAWISSRKDLVAAAFVLPSLLAYLKYRKTGGEKRWYILSLILFVFALAGKLSVATFPAVLFAIDVFMEKRPWVKSLIDKIPFLLAGVIFAVAVANAQPETGAGFDIGVLAKAFGQSMWLLTGFGSYVIYRVRPDDDGVMFQLLGALILLAVFVLPLLLRKRYPLAMILIYWILFTYIPTQVLSFAYPTSDRYLFLPSVAAVILLSWLVVTLIDRLKNFRLPVIAAIILVLAFFWTRNTLQYLSEWQDPRSVWFAAKEKSSDVQVFYNLGWNYLDKAAAFGAKRRKTIPVEEEKKYASVIWKNDPRLPQLLTELSSDQHTGPTEQAFREYLQKAAQENLDQAVAAKGNHIMADMFFHRGMLALDKGDYPAARKEFLAAIDEANRLGYSEGQQEVLVNTHYNLGITEWTAGNFAEALKWIKKAEEEQNRFGGNWFPDIATNRARLEQFIASQR